MKRLFMAASAAFFAFATDGQAQNRSVRVINESGYTVYELYASGTQRTIWGPDRLGSDVLPPGWNVVVDMSDGTGACWMDLKAIGPGSVEWQSQQDVCSIAEWRLTN